MDKLKKKILAESNVSDGDIIRVDMFLNHCLDTDLIEEIGNSWPSVSRATVPPRY